MLKAEKIAELLRTGETAPDPLVISPMPDLDLLKKSGAASVDLRLGRWFMTLRQSRMTHLETSGQTSETEFTKTHYVPFGRSYVLHPGAFVLGATLEWIRLPKDYAAYVIGRSTWGRRGLVIATAIGVHPGFVGSLALELCNQGEIPISIKPGRTICQLCIHSLITESGIESVDKSIFVGRRKPILGHIPPDHIANWLGNAYKEEAPNEM